MLGYPGWRFHSVCSLHGISAYWEQYSSFCAVTSYRRPCTRWVSTDLCTRLVLYCGPVNNVFHWWIPGEFMQLGSKENENERFKHYLEKTFKKTASLIANSCKAVCTFRFNNNKMKFRAEREVEHQHYFFWILGVNFGEFWSRGAWDSLSIWTKRWHCIPGNFFIYMWNAIFTWFK